jgi:ABC-type branched-subunit amino acid transport system ATPase component
VLKVVDIEAGYGRIPVLKGVSLEVREGEIITLIGFILSAVTFYEQFLR